MDVYLVPVGSDRHELYCEVPDDPPDARDDDQDGDQPDTGWRWSPVQLFRRLRARFREMLTEAERERRKDRGRGGAETDGSTTHGWMARAKARVMRWVAESIAEQRLLWHLRRQTEACLFYPDDIDGARATTLLRSLLKKDFDRHRFWLTIDALGFVVSGLLFFVPGPNAVAYYFAFRLVGHYLSMRGAQQGLSGVTWRTEPSAPLAELRRAMALDPAARDEHVREVAGRLKLEHLTSFFARTAVPLP
jgi:Mitochondrial K+-H+ exchange-related